MCWKQGQLLIHLLTERSIIHAETSLTYRYNEMNKITLKGLHRCESSCGAWISIVWIKVFLLIQFSVIHMAFWLSFKPCHSKNILMKITYRKYNKDLCQILLTNLWIIFWNTHSCLETVNAALQFNFLPTFVTHFDKGQCLLAVFILMTLNRRQVAVPLFAFYFGWQRKKRLPSGKRLSRPLRVFGIFFIS